MVNRSIKLVLSFILLNILFVTGCQNTMEGFGKDMQKNGKEIQKSAHD